MDINRLFSVFQTAATGLNVQRRNISIAAENIANANTTRTENGGAYRPKVQVNSIADRQAFQSALRSSMLELQRSDSRHLSLSPAASAAGSPQNLGPDGAVHELDKFRYEYDPDHPDADENGMVKYPGVDMVEEMTRLISANRLFEANLSVIQAEKDIIKNSLQI